jgi:sulfur carrier protein ThiS
MIEVYLGGHLNFYQPEKRNRVSLSVNGRIRLLDMLKQLGIPAEEVAFASVNGEMAELNSALVSPGDRVELYPPMGGG